MKRILAASAWVFVATSAAAQSHLAFDITPGAAPKVVSSIVVHPLDGRRLLAGFAVDMWRGPGTLRASSDGGRTWTVPVGIPSDLKSVEFMYAHEGLPGVVFITEGSGNQTASQFPFPASDAVWSGRTWRSDDFGLTWRVVNAPARNERSIRPFTSDPLDVNRILGTLRSPFVCGLHCFSQLLGGDVTLLESMDGGQTWRKGAGLPDAPTYSFDAPRPINNITPDAIPPLPGSRLFFSNGVNVFVSRDAGRSWDADIRWPGRVVWAKQDPRRLKVLYVLAEIAGEAAGGAARLYRSDDDGATWNLLFEFSHSYTDVGAAVVPNLTIDPVHPESLWLTGFDAGVLYSKDSGSSWSLIGFAAAPTYSPQIENGAFHVNPRERGIVPRVELSPSEPGVAYLLWRDHLYRVLPNAARKVVAAEFNYEGDRYWVTTLDGEALSQDYRAEPGAVRRTGQRWGAWSADSVPVGAVGSCRFWPKPQTGLRTRVLTLQGAECDSIKGSPDWILEAENEFFAFAPDGQGACGTSLVPVRRFHNLQSDANHRWVADAAIAAEMRARGWYDEGVRFCARPLGAEE